MSKKQDRRFQGRHHQFLGAGGRGASRAEHALRQDYDPAGDQSAASAEDVMAQVAAAREQARERMLARAAEGTDLDKLSAGLAVPGHESACATRGCEHAVIWHRRAHGRAPRPCEVPGCGCGDLARRS